MRRAVAFLRELAHSFAENESLDLSAQLAFYALLALFPFAILVATLVGLLPLPGLTGEVEGLVRAFAPDAVQPLLIAAVHNAVRGARPSLLALGFAGALGFASVGVSALMAALNRAHGVDETRPFFLRRLQSLAITLAGAGLVIVASAALLLGPDFTRHLAPRVGLARAFEVAWPIARWPSTVAAMMLLIAFLNWACPSGRRRFRLFSPGAIAAVLGWIALTLAFDFYVRHVATTYNKMYGTLAAGVVLLLWIQLSGLTIIVGGEIDALLERERERKRERDR